MSTARKTITVTDQQDGWIKAQITAGKFTDDNEYIRDLIRRDQASNTEIATLSTALIEAEESGAPQPFDGELFKQEMKTGHVSRASQNKSIERKTQGAELPRSYPCPIPKCPHVFKNSRGGWDSHIASFKRHPNWHPETRDGDKRKLLFKQEFANWFKK